VNRGSGAHGPQGVHAAPVIVEGTIGDDKINTLWLAVKEVCGVYGDPDAIADLRWMRPAPVDGKQVNAPPGGAATEKAGAGTLSCRLAVA
jgi:hypothetical protein